MEKVLDISEKVYMAKDDSIAADRLIEEYMGFIKGQVRKMVGGRDDWEDELSIGMFAFYEAVIAYERSKGAFIPYAARAIRMRLIDYYRRERRHRGVISIHSTIGEDGDTIGDTLPAPGDHAEETERREAAAWEIEEFGKKLAGFGISFSDVADNCPKQGRTLEACGRVLSYAKSRPELLLELERTGKLPVSELVKGSGVERKTVERHRKYLVALLLAFTNGYEIIRGHLYKLASRGEAVS